MENLNEQEATGQNLSGKASIIVIGETLKIDKIEPRPVAILDFEESYEFSVETLRICNEAPLNKMIKNLEWRKKYAS